MTEPQSITMPIGTGDEHRDIAVLRREGNAPGIFWLGGFRSDMVGSKASALDRLGAAAGFAVTRFDYSGHGRSGGDFSEGTISRWLEEAIEVFGTTAGPQVVVGSSMGGWLALLLARHLRRSPDGASAPSLKPVESREPGIEPTEQAPGAVPVGRIKALVLLAPAVDMTEDLMRQKFTKRERAAMTAQGFVAQATPYSEQPHIITRKLLEDGARHLLFGKGIETGCPVTILQGGRDPDVPKAHALKLVQHLLTDPVTFTLIPDGDHRLSRDEDLRLVETTVLRAIEAPPADAVSTRQF